MLLEITKNNGITQMIEPKFPLDKLHDSKYFVSLMFYLGLLTLDGQERARLKIPNHSIRAVFWQYLEEQTIERNKLVINYSRQTEAVEELAFKGNPKPFLDSVSEEVFSKLSNRDLAQFDEKYIKILLLSRLFQVPFLIPVSETELSAAFAQAQEQLEKYRSSHRLADRMDVRYLAVVFIGKDRYEMEELV